MYSLTYLRRQSQWHKSLPPYNLSTHWTDFIRFLCYFSDLLCLTVFAYFCHSGFYFDGVLWTKLGLLSSICLLSVCLLINLSISLSHYPSSFVNLHLYLSDKGNFETKFKYYVTLVLSQASRTERQTCRRTDGRTTDGRTKIDNTAYVMRRSHTGVTRSIVNWHRPDVRPACPH